VVPEITSHTMAHFLTIPRKKLPKNGSPVRWRLRGAECEQSVRRAYQLEFRRGFQHEEPTLSEVPAILL
jgi:hypothetical protein